MPHIVPTICWQLLLIQGHISPLLTFRLCNIRGWGGAASLIMLKRVWPLSSFILCVEFMISFPCYLDSPSHKC